MNTNMRRNERGQAAIPLILVIILIVGLVGIFAFEVTRATMIRDQLRSACESAALGGSAALAGSSQLDPTDSQTKAIDAARTVFVKNDIFGTQLSALESDFANSPAVGHTKIKFQYLDPKNNDAPVAVGDPKAKVLKVQAKFGFSPIFASLLGANSAAIPIEADAIGGVGDLDVVLCFDVSGSMDDFTRMTDVRRRWDPAQGKIIYDVVNQGFLARSHNSVPPQQLEFAGQFNPALRGPQNTGGPPGNFPPGTANVQGMTDSVVNIDEQTAFAGTSQDGFDFPNVGALVEAARGNLESAGVFQQSQANTALSGAVTPKPGYRAAYLKLAKQHTHPLVEAQTAAKEFFALMNKNANPHFGLVAFNDRIGSSPTFTFSESNVADSYPPGGNGQFPLPGISIQKPEDTTNFNEVVNAIDPLVANGATNIGGATNAAVDMFQNGSRDNAKKAIIVFTDGDPTVGGPLSGDPFQNCRLAAAKAKQRGIAVYTVGLALDPSLIQTQRQVLGDDTSSGMAAIAGNGSRFFQVTSAGNIRSAFASIARHLSSLVE